MLNNLLQASREVPKELIMENKYTFAAPLNIAEVRYMDINDIIGVAETKLESFISEYGQILLFPNFVNDTLTDITIRSFDGVGHLKLGQSSLPYNIGNLRPDFKYGDVIYLVEGIADLVTIKLIEPKADVIAMQTSTLGKKQIGVLTSLTNNFVLFRDNDKAGESGARKMSYSFRDNNASFIVYEQFADLKDTGDILEMLRVHGITNDYNLANKITTYSTYYKNIIDRHFRR